MSTIKNTNEKPSFIGALIKRALFFDFIKGLAVTFKYTFKKTISIRYPDEEKWIPYQRFRGALTLNYDDKGRELCVGCELCSKACPTDCITVVPMEDDDGIGITDRISKIWDWNSTRCLYCGYCEDACPTTAVRLGRNYELAFFSLDDAVKDKNWLLQEQEIPESVEGGNVVKAKFVKNEDGIQVIANLDGGGKPRRI